MRLKVALGAPRHAVHGETRFRHRQLGLPAIGDTDLVKVRAGHGKNQFAALRSKRTGMRTILRIGKLPSMAVTNCQLLTAKSAASSRME